MKTILHIGMSKTGSTALQGCLDRSRGILAESGVLYPEIPKAHRTINHKYLVIDLMAHDRLPRHLVRGQSPEQLAEKYRDFRQSLLKQVHETKAGCMVLSAETFFRKFDGAAQARLTRFLAEMRADTEVVAYIRSPAAHFTSILQQTLKASAVVRPPRIPHYRMVIERYEAMFGRPRIRLRAFDRSLFPGGDIVADFVSRNLAAFGVEAGRLLRGPHANEALSAEAADLLREYREIFHADRDDQFTRDTSDLILALGEVDRRLHMPRPVLRSGLAEQIDYATTDLLWLRDRFGVECPGYDYGRIERGQLTTLPPAGRLEDLLVMDPARRAQLAGQLRETDWASEEPVRMNWLARAAGSGAAASPAGPVPGRAAAASSAVHPLPGGGLASDVAPSATPVGLFSLPERIARTLWEHEPHPGLSVAVLAAHWSRERSGRITQILELLERLETMGGRLIPVAAGSAGEEALRPFLDAAAVAGRLADLLGPDLSQEPASQVALTERILMALRKSGYRLEFPERPRSPG